MLKSGPAVLRERLRLSCFYAKSHPGGKDIFHFSNKYRSPVRRQIGVLGLFRGEGGTVFNSKESLKEINPAIKNVLTFLY